MNSYEMAIRIAKIDFYATEIASASSRPAQLFKTIRSLTSLSSGKSQTNKLDISCEAFASFFAEKILRLRQDFSAEFGADSEVEAPRLSCGLVFDHFKLFSLADVDKALKAVRPTTCPLDPCPSWLVKAGDGKVLGPLRDIVNMSLSTGIFPERLKEVVVRPLLKKSGLDPSDPANYRPILHLAFLGKVIERAVVGQLQEFLEETSALDPFQSGFHAGYGLETALVTLTDDLRRQLI